MAGHSYMTKEGYEKLKNELQQMKTEGRKEVAAAIAEARSKGDLSENAEYDAAKDAQGFLEMKINELETTLSNARIIDKGSLDTSEVRVLSKVKLMHTKMKREFIYQLVSEAEANVAQGKISVTSPIGKGLLGHKVGQVAKIDTPSGSMEFEILDITIE